MPGQQSTIPFWPHGGGEIGARISAFDWSSNPLGPIGTWPQSLRSVVECLLNSPLPTKLLWGPELVQIYNEPFAALIGGKHPAGLGQRAAECWAEIMHLSAPYYARVLTGEVLTLHNTNWKIARHGVEDVSFLAHLSPVTDENGCIVGLQAVCVETPEERKKTPAPVPRTEHLAAGIDTALERNLLEPRTLVLSNAASKSSGTPPSGASAGDGTRDITDSIRRLARLTRREQEVLEHVVRGFPNKTTASHLGLSVRTVEVHRARIMHRLGARNVADLVRIALSAELAEKPSAPPHRRH
jgi:DNA-binding CsgD family transcriptional regulator